MIDIELSNLLQRVIPKVSKIKSDPITILTLGFPSLFLPKYYARPFDLETRPPNNSIEKHLKKNLLSMGLDFDYYNFEDLLRFILNNNPFDLQVLDIAKNQYPGLICDLNNPISSNYYNKYDLIVDSGSMEHCFNIGTAFRNIARMIKLDGYIVSAIPYFSPSHGYYNVTPTLLEEFYCPENGFELIFLKCNSSQNFSISLSGKGEILFSLQDLRGKGAISIVPKKPINTIYYIAKKINLNIPDFTLQAKYR